MEAEQSNIQWYLSKQIRCTTNWVISLFFPQAHKIGSRDTLAEMKIMQHMERIQKNQGGKEKKEYIWLFRECLFWIHAQKKKGKMAKSKLCFKEMERKKTEGQREEDSKNTKRHLSGKVQWAAKANVQQHTVWYELPQNFVDLAQTVFLSEPTEVIALGYTLNLLDTPI